MRYRRGKWQGARGKGEIRARSRLAPRPSPLAPGFTIIEMAVSMAIIAIVSLIAALSSTSLARMRNSKLPALVTRLLIHCTSSAANWFLPSFATGSNLGRIISILGRSGFKVALHLSLGQIDLRSVYKRPSTLDYDQYPVLYAWR